MTNDTTDLISMTPADLLARDFDDEFESIGDHHRMAAHHFAAAAKHHLAAAAADDDGNAQAISHHAHLAYRHQLNAVQYAEIAVMDNESLDDEEEHDLMAAASAVEADSASDQCAIG